MRVMTSVMGNGGVGGKWVGWKPARSERLQIFVWIRTSTNLIKKFYKETKGKIKIIGVGGVDSGESAFEKITAGADAVQLYTGMVYKGPGIVKEIKKDLISILKKENIKNVSEAVGINAWPQCIQELYNTRKKLCLKDAN